MIDREKLWEAINAYVRTCGGDPSKHVVGNTARMVAVENIEECLYLGNFLIGQRLTVNMPGRSQHGKQCELVNYEHHAVKPYIARMLDTGTKFFFNEHELVEQPKGKP